MTGGGRAGRGDRGAVTAELAVGLPAVVLLVLAVLGVGVAGVQHMRCAEAARTAARIAALGEPDGEAVAAAHRVAGGGAHVSVTRDDRWVTVTVTAGLPVGALGDAVTVEGRAVAWVEP
ncbi:TadE family type IV pilus minor pilin [Cellulomonas gilvus]|uniref:TadE family protein n=1 Tax=Cellulomonas gilvus (strain ATCC 13127 / NRRL B-14078) TaxID=593907 RepID=F8A3D0_CELGA|nr:TadE family type IV pilus minor pilin [Cellulomonas gilvus]AEI13123.1 TadE family protein [Cellulomonas gilvus ATCC 13127]